jgi:predicted transposase
MKLIAQVKLLPTKEQHNALVDTLSTTNEACNYISQHAWDTRTFRQYDIHKAVYYEVRSRFSLSAQMTVRAIAKVADAYKLDKKTQRIFKTTGGVAYDDRILSYNLSRSTVSIWTTAGRLTIPFTCGERQKELLKTQRGESDLILFKGNFYLLATCDIDEPTPKDVERVLGIDLGIVNIATTSDGDTFAGNAINNVRHRHRRISL